MTLHISTIKTKYKKNGAKRPVFSNHMGKPMQDKIPFSLWFPSTFCVTPSEKPPTPEESDFLDFYQQQDRILDISY